MRTHTLGSKQFTVFLFHINEMNRHLKSQFLQYLSHEELNKIRRIRSLNVQNRCLASRGILRYILGMYTSTDPGQIKFSYNRFGKPFHLQDDVKFNCSSSSEYIMIALHPEYPMGIDIEKCTVIKEADGIAKNYFSDIEYLNFLNAGNKNKCFYNIWVQKEAFLKALGVGLSTDTRSFTVSLTKKDNGYITQNNTLFHKEAWLSSMLKLNLNNYCAAISSQHEIDINISILPSAFFQNF